MSYLKTKGYLYNKFNAVMERNREKKQVLYKFSKYSLFLFIKLKFKSHGKKNSIMSRRSNLVELDI